MFSLQKILLKTLARHGYLPEGLAALGYTDTREWAPTVGMTLAAGKSEQGAEILKVLDLDGARAMRWVLDEATGMKFKIVKENPEGTDQSSSSTSNDQSSPENVIIMSSGAGTMSIGEISTSHESTTLPEGASSNTVIGVGGIGNTHIQMNETDISVNVGSLSFTVNVYLGQDSSAPLPPSQAGEYRELILSAVRTAFLSNHSS